MANFCWNLKRLLLLALVCQISVSQRVCPSNFRYASQTLVQRVGQWPASAGQSVSVRCPEGRRLNINTTTITCSDNGQWTPYWPKCLIVRCAPLNVSNGSLSSKKMKAGEKVTVTCSPGYTLNGSSTLTCLNNGLWSPQKPTCVRLCSRPPVIDKQQLRERYVLQKTFNVGVSVSYTCAVGYTRTGGSSISQCTEKGWTRTTLRCELMSCGSAGEIPNGKYNYNEGVEFGSKVTAECNEGYHLIGGNVRLCISTGWDGREAVCEPVQCPPPSRVPGAELSGSVDEPHLYGHVVNYRCPKGYLVGEREIHCTKNGNWSAPSPRCTDVTCRQPVLRFGSRSWNYKLNYRPDEQVGVRCDQGYRLMGASTLTCGTDGQWSPPVPKCVLSPPQTQQADTWTRTG